MQKRHPLYFQFDRTNRTSGRLLHSITAKATDNSGNVASNNTTSAAIQLTVTAHVVQTYYIHTDQLNTPRLITNSANAKVWEWNNDDPFANNPVNDDPNATGNHFTYNPRLPGQYFDSETGTYYNYYRDYDPATGRYIESDPIGLAGGINTYGYVGGNPLSYSDPLGLKGNLGAINALNNPGFNNAMGELPDASQGECPNILFGPAACQRKVCDRFVCSPECGEKYFIFPKRHSLQNPDTKCRCDVWHYEY